MSATADVTTNPSDTGNVGDDGVEQSTVWNALPGIITSVGNSIGAIASNNNAANTAARTDLAKAQIQANNTASIAKDILIGVLLLGGIYALTHIKG